MTSAIVFSGNIILLAISGVYDLKYKKIPNICVLCMLTLYFVTHAAALLITGITPLTVTILRCAIAAITPFFLMLPAELMTKRAFGAGDKKVLFVLALSTGTWGIVFVMFGMMAGGLIFGMVKKVERREKIAMAPFILVSYFVVGMLRCFIQL